MRRLPFLITAGLLTFFIGVALVWTWVIPWRHPAMINAGRNAPTTLSPAKATRTYLDVDHASVRVRDGGYRASVSTLESSDGMRFTSTVAVLPSEERAQSEMHEILQKASKIINREPLFDERGERVGEKAVAMFTANGHASAGSAELLWTHGAELTRISSPSLQSVLEYEKDHDW